jgi:hypothetical protein
MTTASGVAVIATQVARTDRRALSEAWYSALHLAHAPASRSARAARTLAPAPSTTPAALPRGRSGERHTGTQPATGTRRAHRENELATTAPLERRRPACANARRIERAVTALAAHWHGQAAQTVDIAGGRVRLLVRADRGTTRIVAVCSPPLRDTVERALASARFALAQTGVTVAAP